MAKFLVHGFFQSLLWYPPAESQIPLRIFLQGGRFSHSDAERTLCGRVNAAHCLLGPSGRAMLYRLLTELKKVENNSRDEILVPGYTCYSVAAAVAKAKLKIRLYDIEPESFSPKISSLSSNLNKRTLAVISQHLLGVPTDIGPLGRMARDTGAYHIEDTAQALGGNLNAQPLGGLGDFGLFSFGRGKPLPLGGGGALTSRRFPLSCLSKGMKINSGWQSLLTSILTQPVTHPRLYGIAEALPLGLGETIFDPEFESCNIPSLVLKLITPMMATLAELNLHRRAIATIYQNSIPASCLVRLPTTCTPVFPRYPVLANEKPLNDELTKLGVRRLYPRALNQEPQIMAYAVNTSQRMMGAETISKRLITLPTHRGIDSALAEKIANCVTDWLFGGNTRKGQSAA